MCHCHFFDSFEKFFRTRKKKMHTTTQRLLIIATLLLIVMAGCSHNKKTATTAAPKPDIPVDTALQSRLAEFAAKPRVQGQLGIYVYDLTADKPVFGMNEGQSLPVASCTKLLTTVAGLHLLGSNYRYSTSLYTHGKMKNDTLVGDVIFKADLDPQLQPENLALFTSALKQQGIDHVQGRLVLDLLLKDKVQAEAHWYPWDLSFSRYGMLYKGPDKVRNLVKAQFASAGYHFDDAQVIYGKVPRGSVYRFRYSSGIQMAINHMLKHSSNTQATALLYTMGHRSNPRQAPATAGVEYMRRFMRHDLGLADTSLVVHDGCGLCIHNHLSPVALATILKYGYRHKDIYKSLLTGLSISGIDGTLRGKGYDREGLKGMIHGKTGTLSHPYGISSIAGYCQDGNGHDLAFVMLNTQMSVLDARLMQRNFCEALVGEAKQHKKK